MPRKTQEAFTEDLKDVSPEIEVLGEYRSSKTPIKCRCSVCGHVWYPRPNNLLRGRKCPVCALKRRGEKRRKSHEQFVAEVANINPLVEILEDYSGDRKDIAVRCLECGFEWKTKPRGLLQGTGCPRCAGVERYTSESFMEKLEELNPNIDVLGEYINSHARIQVRCKICDYEWFPVAGKLLLGTGCPRCAGKMKKTHEQFVAEMRIAKPSIEVLGQYVDSRTGVQLRCRNCGRIWTTTPAHILFSGGCPSCANTQKSKALMKTHEQYVRDVAHVNPNVEIIGIYKGDANNIDVRCRICGYKWSPQSGSLLQGSGCPKCAKSSTSFMEQFVYRAFCLAVGEDNVVAHDRNTIGMELDIFLPSLRAAVEIGSWAWHKNKVHRDLEKRLRCSSKRIRLFTIYDFLPDDVACPFDGMADFYRFASDIGGGTEHAVLIQLVSDVFASLGVSCSFDEKTWEKIEAYAQEFSRKRTTERFIEEMAAINPRIEIVGDYIDTRTKIECLCRECGHRWNVTPSSILRGSGCPKCGTQRAHEQLRKTNQQFLEELASVNPTIEVLSPYSNSDTKVDARCKICGHSWSVLPHNLLRGQGCPKCARISSARKRRKTHSQFVEEMSVKYPELEVLGKYISGKDRILVRCKICGHEWSPCARSLVSRKAGCRVCANKRAASAEKQDMSSLCSKE